MSDNISIYKIQLVKENMPSKYNTRINSPECCANLARDFMKQYNDREVFILVCLSTKNTIAGINLVSMGSINSSIVHPREVYKPAILANSARIIVAHNHPSGDLEPSKEDIALTKRLYEAGEIIGVELLDHLIIGEGDDYLSMKAKNLF